MLDKNSHPRTSWSRVGIGLLLGVILLPRASFAVEPKSSSSFAPTADGRQRIIPHPKIGSTPASSSTSSSTWWLGTAGIALALAAFGGVVVAARKLKPGGETGPLRVLSRTSLSPRHSVYLVKAGDRVLIIGTGPQGAPSLLGEMDREEEEVKPVTRHVAGSLVSNARLRVGGGV